MRPLFIVTSAVDTRYGIYSPQERLKMTLDTIQCLRDRVPGCKIALNEVSGNGLAAEFAEQLEEAVEFHELDT